MATVYYPSTRLNSVKKAPFGAILGTALKIGQTVGAMMPDTNAGNVIKGVVDPIANLGAGLAYMSEGKVGKGLLSLIPGVGTYLQGKDQDEREAEAKRMQEANAAALYAENTRQSSVADLANYKPTNNVNMYPDGGVIGKPTMTLNNTDVIKFASMKRMSDGLAAARKLNATNTDLMRIAKMKYWLDGSEINPEDTNMYNLIYDKPTTNGAGRQNVNPMPNGGKLGKKPVTINGPIVYSRNDSRFKAYADSLNLYNSYERINKSNDPDKIFMEELHRLDKMGLDINNTTHYVNKYSPSRGGNVSIPYHTKPTQSITVANMQPMKSKTDIKVGYNKNIMTPTRMVALRHRVPNTNPDWIEDGDFNQAQNTHEEIQYVRRRIPTSTIDNKSNMITVKANGGKLDSINSALSPMGGQQAFSPISGSPMTQGATIVTTPAGSTAGYHETGNNVPIINEQGQTQAIAEPGEVVVDDLVISKRNGLAQKYIAIEKQKGLLVTKLEKAKTPEAKAGITRSIEYFDKQLEGVKLEQEQLAQQMQSQGGVPMAANGFVGSKDPNLGYDPFDLPLEGEFGNIPGYNPNGASNFGFNTPSGYMNVDSNQGERDNTSSYAPNVFDLGGSSDTQPTDDSFDWEKGLNIAGDIAGMVLPSIMNYKNSKLMDESMKEIMSRRPMLNKLNYISPDFQIGDQVAGINNNFAVMSSVAGKVGNPLTASSILATAGADRASKLNEVFGAKNRADDQTRFRQSMMTNQMTAQNTQISNADADFKLENRLSLNNAKINLNNTTADNIYTMLQEGNLKQKDKLTLEMAVQQLNQYGVVGRKLSEQLKAMGIEIPETKIKGD